jgi:hypothetical protein
MSNAQSGGWTRLIVVLDKMLSSPKPHHSNPRESHSMERRNELPPTHTIRPIDTPPDSDQSTTAQLKADINSGRTGDKVEVFDPGLSPLGTDDEAAGTPAEPHRIKLARRLEGAKRWVNGVRPSGAHHQTDHVLTAYVLGIVLTGCILIGGISWGRHW